jgi:uncharacterized membrane protein
MLMPAMSTNRTKVFCFFFSKKKYFLALPLRQFLGWSCQATGA